MGSMRKRENTYTLTVSLGRDMNGKQIRKNSTFTPPAGVSEGKADKLAAAALYEFEQSCRGKAELRENMRFSDLSKWYFDNYAASVLKEITAYNYQHNIKNHILPKFGNLKIKDITTPKLTEFYKELKLNPASVRKLHIELSSIFTCAVKQGFLKENPCKNAILPKFEKKEKLFLDERQAKQLLTFAEEYSEFNTVIKLLLYTGMRSGECLGLQWTDIDFENEVISVQHTLTDVGGKHYLTSPKTSKSARTIKISNEVIIMLKTHKARQAEKRLALGDIFLHPEMVFTSETGNFVDRSRTNLLFRKFVKANGLPAITLHDLRHCNATLLINAGIPLKIISEHLGHSDISTTANTYGHVLESSRARVSDVLALKLK